MSRLGNPMCATLASLLARKYVTALVLYTTT